MILGIIGTGNIGMRVARLAVAAGVPVVLANSRGPASLVDAVAELGDLAAADVLPAVVERSDLVLLSVPIGAVFGLPADAFEGKVVIDPTNYYREMAGPIAELDASGLTSSEFLQQRLPGAVLVKALNNVDFVRLPRLSRLQGDSDRSALPIASDDLGAKQAVTALLDRLGFDVLDLGALAEGWRSQPGTPLSVSPYSRDLQPVSADPYERFMMAETVPVPLGAARALAAEAVQA